MTGIPFMPRKGAAPYWFRTDEADLELHRRMLEALRQLHKEYRDAKATKRK
jgi:hypothetical protein